ncbi:MAG TPA: pentapeptide repeat-containing protein [Candidatus Elarobacter sp.]|jgi:uncharacterized protein YjbI with pentapeptide repeats/beta-lactamase regulating signal transducer with metallopeptidase domain|nr:pentapeptide repeat-containing protein [Candidatus Elarobacter sp.]
MIEAVVGVALRAILASVVLGGVLAGLVLVATRRLNLTASSRHALWTTALIATAVMPLAGIGVSLARATAAAPAASTTVPAPDAAPASGATSPVAPATARSSDRTSRTSQSRDVAVRDTARRPSSKGAADFKRIALEGPSLWDRLSVIRWTPKMSRNLAVGVVGVWVLGALAGLIGLAASVVRVRGLKRRSSPLDGTLADELPWLTEVGPGREIWLRLSFETETPVAIGFRRPVILIPTEIATADGLAAIEQLVLHEHAHLRRYDDWTNLVQRVIERIFWFNPIVWLVGRRIALEREIASDDAVVEKTGEAHAYAASLWRLAREMRMPEHAVVAPGALLTRKQITVRIEQLLDKKRARLHRSPLAALGVALASVLAVVVVATSAPAVELPALADTPSGPVANAGSPSRWHAEVVAAKPRSAAVAHVTAPSAHDAPRSAAHAADTRQIAILEPKTVNFQLVALPTIAPRAHGTVAGGSHPPAALRRDAGSHDTMTYVTTTGHGPTVSSTTVASSGSGTASGSVNMMPMPVPVPVLRERIAVIPPVPRAPLAPLSPRRIVVAFPQNVSPLTAEQVAKLTAAAQSAVTRNLKDSHDAADVGPEVAKALKLAMGSMPQQVGQESTWSAHTRLAGVKLSRELVASCTACSLRGADLRNVDLHGLKLNGDDLTGADMRGVNLSGAQLIGMTLRGANLSGADLRNAELNGVDLRDANFDNAQLDGIKLIGVSVQRVSLRGTTLRSLVANCIGCDFSRLDLHGQDLHGISLSGADLTRADLHDANLSGARFSGVDLSNANLTGANLTNARFDGCNFTGVELRGARTAGMTMTGSSGLDG